MACTSGAPGCFTEHVFNSTDHNCSFPSFELLLHADGRCNPAIVDGQVVNFYEIECQDGNLVGKGGCDSSCNNCIAPVVTMATDGSCNSLSLIDGTSVNIQLRGQCYVCTPGSPGCITENVFTDHTCGTPAFASIQLLADGNCNGIVLPDGSTPNYYQLTCEDGFATGRGNCDSTCNSCVVVDGRLPTDGSCISVPSGSGSNASNAYFTLTGGCPPPPVCTAGAPGCFTERIFAHSDCSGSSETEVLVLADGRCNPAIVDGQVVNFYEIECQDGNLVGKGGCDSSCNNCIAPGVTITPDGSCTLLQLTDGDIVYIQFSGQCPTVTSTSASTMSPTTHSTHDLLNAAPAVTRVLLAALFAFAAHAL